MGVNIVDGEDPPDYLCEECAPESHKELLQASSQGRKLWEDRRKLHAQEAVEEPIPKRQRKKKAKKAAKDRQSLIQDTSMDEADETTSQELSTASFPLTDECHHYTSINEVPWDIQK